VTIEFKMTSINLHGGIDAWGRRFDALDQTVEIGGDIMFLQECWTTQGDEPFAAQVAHRLGGTAVEATMATGRRAQPHPNPPAGWQRRRSFLDGDHGLYLESEIPLSESMTTSERYVEADPGTFSLAMVSRFPVLESTVVHLGRLRKDRTQRSFIVATLDLGGTRLVAVAAHMTHLTYGSPLHFRRLRKGLRHLGQTDSPIVLGGDMNLWGPAVSVQLPRLRRAVKGKTWPAWGPHSQLDHLFVNRHVTVLDGHVAHGIGSDHLPVTATCAVRSDG
jgi:endonuclease/exonuclease/phosphatase family metal-dependent hydrolase